MKQLNELGRHIRPIAGQLQEAINRVMESGWFVLGSEVSLFEREFAAYCGSEHCVSVANGTDALELALRALGITHGCNVLTVANGGMYSTTAILAAGAMPVYADINSNTSLIDISDVHRLIETAKIDAIIVTHLYGLIAGIQEVVELARAKGLPVVEDCAQAHGASIQGRKAGSFGDIGCFSFYPTKNLGALGDGGAIVSNRSGVAERVRQLRQYGWDSKYRAALSGGRNSRLDELQAAILRVKLPMLDQWNSRRREIAKQYSRGIHHGRIATPSVQDEEYVAHLYVIKATERDKLRQYLKASSIPSDVHYPIPDYRQPCYADLFRNVSKPVTDQHCAEALSLPCFPEMTDEEVDMVIRCINAWQCV